MPPHRTELLLLRSSIHAWEKKENRRHIEARRTFNRYLRMHETRGPALRAGGTETTITIACSRTFTAVVRDNECLCVFSNPKSNLNFSDSPDSPTKLTVSTHTTKIGTILINLLVMFYKLQYTNKNKLQYTNKNIEQVSCGSSRIAVLDTERNLYIHNNVVADDYQKSPQPFKSVKNVQHVSCGPHHTAYISQEGSLHSTVGLYEDEGTDSSVLKKNGCEIQDSTSDDFHVLSKGTQFNLISCSGTYLTNNVIVAVTTDNQVYRYKWDKEQHFEVRVIHFVRSSTTLARERTIKVRKTCTIEQLKTAIFVDTIRDNYEKLVLIKAKVERLVSCGCPLIQDWTEDTLGYMLISDNPRGPLEYEYSHSTLYNDMNMTEIKEKIEEVNDYLQDYEDKLPMYRSIKSEIDDALKFYVPERQELFRLGTHNEKVEELQGCTSGAGIKEGDVIHVLFTAPPDSLTTTPSTTSCSPPETSCADAIFGNHEVLTFEVPLDKSTAITSVSCSADHTAVVAGGRLYTCGKGTQGQLGLGNTDDHSTFQKIDIKGVESVQSVSCGAHHTACIADGKLYTFGSNSQLGRDSTPNHTPQEVHVGGKAVTEVSCGDTYTVVRCEDDTVYTFGKNVNRRLGYKCGTEKPKCTEDVNNQLRPKAVEFPTESKYTPLRRKKIKK